MALNLAFTTVTMVCRIPCFGGMLATYEEKARAAQTSRGFQLGARSTILSWE
ncbi:MAG: hypothetical protein HC869_02485 [Rhodospirillales bacterium]|nr:hypothetical protein [Rhodospirillales bacterium]